MRATYMRSFAAAKEMRVEQGSGDRRGRRRLGGGAGRAGGEAFENLSFDPEVTLLPIPFDYRELHRAIRRQLHIEPPARLG